MTSQLEDAAAQPGRFEVLGHGLMSSERYVRATIPEQLSGSGCRCVLVRIGHVYAIHVTGNAGQCRRTMRPARNVEFIKAIAVGQRFDDERGFA